MEYKVLDFNQMTGTLLVNFFTTNYPEGLNYGVDVPVVGGAYISGEDLHDYILSFAPYEQIARLVVLRDSQIAPPSIPIEPKKISNPILDAVSLEQSKIIAAASIDEAAGAARARFITVTPGQEATYITKYEQAKQFRDAGFLGDAPPFIAAEAAARMITAQAVAEEVISVAVPWETIIGPRIEALRMAGKSQIVTASTQQDVDALTRQFVSQLQEIKP